MNLILRLGPLAIYRSHNRLIIYLGPWCSHYRWPTGSGRFGNRSQWRSGWHNWRNQPDY